MAKVTAKHPAGLSTAEAAGKGSQRDAPPAERIVSALLRYGVSISLALVLLGGVLLVAETGLGHSLRVDPRIAPMEGATQPWPRTIGGVLRGALDLDPDALILLGLLLLIATPVLRVVVSMVLFLVEGDYVYVGITLFVLAMLVLGFVLGAAHG